MFQLICKFITGAGLMIIGFLTARGVLTANPSEYREIIAAILAVGGLIILWLPTKTRMSKEVD